MFSSTIARSLVVVAAIVVAFGCLLPAPHAHLDRDRAIVHVHAVADAGVSHYGAGADHDHAAFDHGGHLAAPTKVSAYDIASRFVLTVMTVGAGAAFEAPAPGGMRQPRRTALLPTHDPPLRFVSSPAPPAVV